MDNLAADEVGVKGLIELLGCQLLCLPTYSPALNSMGEVFSSTKGLLRKAEARAHIALVEARGRALSAISVRDIHGFFGYRTLARSL